MYTFVCMSVFAYRKKRVNAIYILKLSRGLPEEQWELPSDSFVISVLVGDCGLWYGNNSHIYHHHYHYLLLMNEFQDRVLLTIYNMRSDTKDNSPCAHFLVFLSCGLLQSEEIVKLITRCTRATESLRKLATSQHNLKPSNGNFMSKHTQHDTYH